MIPKKLADITLQDLQTLVDNQVGESKTLEYKRHLPTAADKKEEKFLSGISAMANTSGGDFIIGIEEKDHIPTKVTGVPLADPDQEILRLENWLRDGLEPRLPGCDIGKPIPVDDKGTYVIIIRVAQSWIAPHRVITGNGHDKFYGRNSRGIFSLDVSELRTAFTLSEQISARIRDFRVQRIAAIAGNEAPFPLSDHGKLILHLVPLSAFTNPHELDLVACFNRSEQPLPMGRTGWDRKMTLDGLANFSAISDNIIASYSLLFRTGILESVLALTSPGEEKVIPGVYYETQLINYTSLYLKYLTKLEITPPIFLFLTLANVRGYALLPGERVSFYRALDPPMPLRQDVVALPEIVLESLDIDIAITLKPLFDRIWNAFGYLRSYNYNKDGQWKE